MVKLVKIRYISGKSIGFEHVMKEELARVLEKRGQIEILPRTVSEKPKKESKTEKPEAGPKAKE